MPFAGEFLLIFHSSNSHISWEQKPKKVKKRVIRQFTHKSAYSTSDYPIPYTLGHVREDLCNLERIREDKVVSCVCTLEEEQKKKVNN